MGELVGRLARPAHAERAINPAKRAFAKAGMRSRAIRFGEPWQSEVRPFNRRVGSPRQLRGAIVCAVPLGLTVECIGICLCDKGAMELVRRPPWCARRSALSSVNLIQFPGSGISLLNRRS